MKKFKIFTAISENMRKKDSLSSERLENSRIRTVIEKECEKHLKSPDDLFEFEALPSVIDATLTVLEEPHFLERYEFSQISESCFLVRQRELEIL